MANIAVLAARHTLNRSASLADQPEIGCRRPELEKTSAELPSLLHGGSLLANATKVASPRPPVTRCFSETGSGIVRTGSSCFPAFSSSSSKHFRSSSSADPITPDDLASLVGACGSDVTGCCHVVVVDCRTFLAFNTNHVTGAFNASCGDRFSRKRLTQGRATVAELISGGPSPPGDEVGGARETFRRLAEAAASSPSGLFVAYDDNTTKLDSLQESHPLRLLTTSLTGSGYRTKFLEGSLYSQD